MKTCLPEGSIFLLIIFEQFLIFDRKRQKSRQVHYGQMAGIVIEYKTEYTIPSATLPSNSDVHVISDRVFRKKSIKLK